MLSEREEIMVIKKRHLYSNDLISSLIDQIDVKMNNLNQDSSISKGDQFMFEIGDIIDRGNGDHLYMVKGFKNCSFDDYGIDQLTKVTGLPEKLYYEIVYGISYLIDSGYTFEAIKNSNYADFNKLIKDQKDKEARTFEPGDEVKVYDSCDPAIILEVTDESHARAFMYNTCAIWDVKLDECEKTGRKCLDLLNAIKIKFEDMS